MKTAESKRRQTRFAMRRGALPLVATIVLSLCLCGVARQHARAIEPRASGLNELVVLDPGAHPRGLPAILTEPTPDGLLVDIPPTVHVHPYYYSGDKEFQGPIIQGGPVRVVANHPKTGQRTYVDVTLPAGAPIIAHSKCAITYVYPDRRVAVNFPILCPDRVRVKHHSGRGLGRRTIEAKDKLAAAAKQTFSQSSTVQSLKSCSTEGGKTLVGLKDGLDSSAALLLNGARRLANAVPGVAALKGRAEDKPYREYANTITAARREAEAAAPAFVPTNR